MWTYEGYWNVVFGPYESPADLVRQHGLAEMDPHELADWLEKAEETALVTGSGWGCVPPAEWADHRARAMGELEAAQP